MRKSFILFTLVILITSLIISPVQAYTNTGKGINTNVEKGDETDVSQSSVDIKQTGERINFADEKLELVVREQVGKISGDLLPSDLEEITNINAYDKGITSLEGIQYLTNLTSLSLRWNQIQDLGPLSSLKNIKSLNLDGNRISDISPLGSLSNLSELDLSSNTINDLEALSGLVNLERLGLRYNRVTDINPLESLINLKYIDLSDNLIKDISSLVKISTNGGLGKYNDEYGYERSSTVNFNK